MLLYNFFHSWIFLHVCISDGLLICLKWKWPCFLIYFYACEALWTWYVLLGDTNKNELLQQTNHFFWHRTTSLNLKYAFFSFMNYISNSIILWVVYHFHRSLKKILPGTISVQFLCTGHHSDEHLDHWHIISHTYSADMGVWISYCIIDG